MYSCVIATHIPWQQVSWQHMHIHVPPVAMGNGGGREREGRREIGKEEGREGGRKGINCGRGVWSDILHMDKVTIEQLLRHDKGRGEGGEGGDGDSEI